MQPKNWAQSVAVAHLRLERRDGGWHVVARDAASLVQAHGHSENAQVLAATQEGHRAAVAYATTAIGSTAASWRADSARVVDTPLIDFILEVETQGDRRAARVHGGLRSRRVARSWPDHGRAARRRSIRTTTRCAPCSITGAQLRAYLEQSARYFRKHDGVYDTDPQIPGFNYDIVSGVDYTIDVDRPVGERITQLEYQGRAVVPTDSFTMALEQLPPDGWRRLLDAARRARSCTTSSRRFASC